MQSGASIGEGYSRPSTYLPRWSPRLQRLIKHLAGVLPSDSEIDSLDIFTLGKDSQYIKSTLAILVQHSFIIIPEYDGEFSIFVLAAYKIPVELVKKGVAYVEEEFN